MQINRRQFLVTSSVAAAAAFLPIPKAFARRRNFTELRRGVGTFEARGGTMGWLVRNDAVVVVDSQFPDTAAQFVEGLQERTSRRIDLLINSHHHGDHTAGNKVLRPHVESIVGQANVPILQKRTAEQRDTVADQAYADITYENEWRQDVGDETMRLKYYGNAHTAGDSVIHFEKADVVHMGDLIFNRLPAFIDVPNGATTKGWAAMLEQVHKDFTDETLFIYGHGNEGFGVTGTRADLLVMSNFLQGLIAHVEKGMQAGQSVDEMVVPKLPDFPDHYTEAWAGAIERCIRTVHGELTAEG